MKHEWVYRTSGYSQCLRCDVMYRCKQSNLPVDGCTREEGNPPKPSPVLTMPYKPGSLLGRMGGMPPTVELNSKAAEGISPERQALMDIQEYMKNFDGTRCAFTDIQEIIDEVLYD